MIKLGSCYINKYINSNTIKPWHIIPTYKTVALTPDLLTMTVNPKIL